MPPARRRRPPKPPTRPSGAIEVLNVRVKIETDDEDHSNANWIHRKLGSRADESGTEGDSESATYGVDGLGIVPGARTGKNADGEAASLQILHMTEQRARACASSC